MKGSAVNYKDVKQAFASTFTIAVSPKEQYVTCRTGNGEVYN